MIMWLWHRMAYVLSSTIITPAVSPKPQMHNSWVDKNTSNLPRKAFIITMSKSHHLTLFKILIIEWQRAFLRFAVEKGAELNHSFPKDNCNCTARKPSLQFSVKHKVPMKTGQLDQKKQRRAELGIMDNSGLSVKKVPFSFFNNS